MRQQSVFNIAKCSDAQASVVVFCYHGNRIVLKVSATPQVMNLIDNQEDFDALL